MSESEKLKWGYTTGACATAASKAALELLLSKEHPTKSTITLPDGTNVPFQITGSELKNGKAKASVIKDGGDDPDVTHGLTISSTVSFSKTPGVTFIHGKGVGTITLPGFEIPVGETAVNPVPRKMITIHIQEILEKYSIKSGVEISISVNGGETIAEKTFNPRLGIVGGISILGTTGRVKPYSSEAFIASIEKSIQISVAQGFNEIYINSGGRSEAYLKEYFSNVPSYAFVQYGNWIGETLEIINNHKNIKKVTLGIMLGKAVKLGEGHLNTHSKTITFNADYICSIAKHCGYSEEIVNEISQLTLARNITKHIPFSLEEPFFKELQSHCQKTCQEKLTSSEISIVLVGQEGQILV